MRYNVDKITTIDLGRQGENLARTVEIDVSSMLERWPEAEIVVLVRRRYDTAAYIALTEVRDSVLYWPVTATDTAQAGIGRVEIRAMCGDVLAKSAMGAIHVAASLTGEETQPPEAAKGWVDEVLEAGRAAETGAALAQESAQRAQETADALSGLSARAVTLDPGSEATVSLEGNVMVYGIPRGDVGPQGEQGIPGKDGRDGQDGKDAVVDATLTQSGQAADSKITGDALACKLTEPAEGLAVGRYFRIASIDDTGHAVLEAVDAKTVGVQDVQVDGTSIVENGVASVPIANAFGKTGAVKLSPSGGIKWSNNIDALSVDCASQNAIDSRSSNNNPLIPYYLDFAVRAAMCDGKGAAWTANEQAAARERMGQETINRERERRLVNLEYAARDYLYREETDAELAYEKAVPDDVTPWITLDRIGGRTLVWNQMVDYLQFPNSIITIGGENVPVTKYDGNITFSAASYGDVRYYSYQTDYPSFAVGHKILIRGCPAGGGTDTWQLYLQGNHSIRDEGEGAIVTIENDTFNPMFRIAAGYHPEIVFTPQMFDLTMMFGSGNEPTVEEFNRMFPLAYYPYAEPMLMTLSCSTVQTRGRNLYGGIDSFRWEVGTTYAYARLPTDEVYSLQVKVKEGNEITAGMYFGFGTGDYNTGDVTWLVQDGVMKRESATSHTSQHYLICYPKALYPSLDDNLEISLVKGSAPEFIPYRTEAFHISDLVAKYFPEGMRSAGGMYDEIDLENCLAIQRVKKKIFDGTEKWTRVAELDTCYRFYADALENGTGNAGTNNVVCNKLETNQGETVDKTGCCLTGNAPSSLFSIILPKAEFPDGDSVQAYVKAFADAGDPMVAYYGLYSPIETPVIEELPVNIEVEAGGSLTFVNDHGGDYRVPVPNQQTWLVKLGGAN